MNLTFHWLLPSTGDLCLLEGAQPALVAEKVGRIRRVDAELGGLLTVGIRLHLVSRETSEAAWAEAERMSRIHGMGAGSALVGSYEEVGERISEYADLGIDHFFLTGLPQAEEAQRFADHVVPVLRRRGLLAEG